MTFPQPNWTDNDLNKICVVGMACRLPGAPSVEAFWQNLMNGTEGIHETRDWPDGTADKGGFLADIKSFDASFFNISPHEALCMDPQQRHLLEVSWQAIESSGLSIEKLREMRTGIFTASLPGDYKKIIAEHKQEAVSPHSFSGNAPSALSGRLSYFYDFQGPSVTLDTACSSGLTALHYACLSLKAEECEAALAGAVSLFATPELFQLAKHANMLSRSHRCAVFDASADGFIPSEGVVAIIVMPLQKALLLKLPVHGLIDSLCLNHDGLSNGLMAPNARAQQALIQKSLKKSNIAPEALALVESHGTGTRLGDLVELKGLTGALGEKGSFSTPCYLGASKALTGHTLVCSGLISLIKVILCAEHGHIPGHPTFQQLAEDASPGPCTINQKPVPWPKGKRHAAVSAFGFTGSNAHLIVKFGPDELAFEHSFANYFVFSAVRKDQLPARLEAFRRFMEAHPEWTLQALSSRLLSQPRHFAFRLALYAGDRKRLLSGLQHLLQENAEKLYSDESFPDVLFAESAEVDASHAIIQQWLRGDDSKLPYLTLPVPKKFFAGHPFEKRSFWLQETETPLILAGPPSSSVSQAVHSALGGLLGYDIKAIDDRRSLMELGIDSLTGMQFLGMLEQQGIKASIDGIWQASSLAAFITGLERREKPSTRSIDHDELSRLGLSLHERDADSSIQWVVSLSPGEAVLLLPPLNTTWRAWLRQIPMLHAAGYRLHIPYYPGHHQETDRLDHSFSLQQVVDQLIAWMRKNGIQPHFVGWSLGGVLSLLAALTDASIVKSMMLVGCAAQFDSELFSRTIEMQEELRQHADLLSIAFNTKETPQKFISAGADMGILKYYYEALMNLRLSVDDMRSIEVPTGIFHGAKDPVVHESHRQFLLEIKHSVSEICLESGHFIPITMTKKFNSTLLAFLRGIRG